MEDFNLVIKELINKNIEEVDLPENLRENFEKTAEKYIKDGNLLEAIKVFTLTKNKEKLIHTSNLCLKENKPYEALQGFLYSKDIEKLNKIGFIMLQLSDIKSALIAFKKADNQEMVEFITKNF